MPRIESNPDHFGPVYTIVRNIALGWLLSAPHLFRAAFDMFALGGGFIFFVGVLVHNVVEKATGVVLPVWVGASVYILFFQAIFFDTIPGKRFIDKVLFCMLGFIFVSHILLLYLVWTMFSMVWVVLAEMVFCIALVFVVAAYTFLKKELFSVADLLKHTMLSLVKPGISEKNADYDVACAQQMIEELFELEDMWFQLRWTLVSDTQKQQLWDALPDWKWVWVQQKIKEFSVRKSELLRSWVALSQHSGWMCILSLHNGDVDTSLDNFLSLQKNATTTETYAYDFSE